MTIDHEKVQGEEELDPKMASKLNGTDNMSVKMVSELDLVDQSKDIEDELLDASLNEYQYEPPPVHPFIPASDSSTDFISINWMPPKHISIHFLPTQQPH